MGDVAELIACIFIGTFYASTFLAVWAAVEGVYALLEWWRRK